MAVTVAEVDAAIAAINSGGQSISVEGMSYSAANLSDLMALRETLQQETVKSNGTRPLYKGLKFNNMGY